MGTGAGGTRARQMTVMTGSTSSPGPVLATNGLVSAQVGPGGWWAAFQARERRGGPPERPGPREPGRLMVQARMSRRRRRWAFVFTSSSAPSRAAVARDLLGHRLAGASGATW
ncbi:hypothetical protein AV521_44040 [Streptomyces sp. IMTB 2501]|nr:hypothetical protein AV521_44040 [Streptomyces sp. IMTB 2501]